MRIGFGAHSGGVSVRQQRAQQHVAVPAGFLRVRHRVGQFTAEVGAVPGAASAPRGESILHDQGCVLGGGAVVAQKYAGTVASAAGAAKFFQEGAEGGRAYVPQRVVELQVGFDGGAVVPWKVLLSLGDERWNVADVNLHHSLTESAKFQLAMSGDVFEMYHGG